MANEDPGDIPEQIRQNRPFFLVLGLAFVVSIGAFLYILFLDTESRDIERNAPPAVTAPAAPSGETAPAEGN
ncbi:hypothetical protein JWJ88_03830 [Paracoccus methylovorus]|uniref:Conjugal transfer protein TrbI n=1 Tax=Paracoccus methylovorus TaxID=2812658 RepID=A0ABX7JKH9_9RHOB|nr:MULTISPECIES: hypothetical protein [Paracoccus]QRZ13803.1 hypothetical protein JWJ88_03830 [Paracoccus methylovorus]